MMRRLSALQRGYLTGLRRARAKAQRERDALAARFEDTIDEIRGEMRGVRSELARLRTLDNALLAERDADAWRQLN